MKMRSHTVFQNKAVDNGREGYVAVGEVFETDDVHGRELQALGHASPVEDEEPKTAAKPTAKARPAA